MEQSQPEIPDNPYSPETIKKLFEDAGIAIGNESMTRTGDGAFGAINGELDDGRSINVVIIENQDGSQVTVNYNQKKQ